MKWSWRIGRVAGIGVYLHLTFLLLLAWIGISHYLRDSSIVHTLGSLVYIVLLFGIVVLHELGHALAARRYGIQTTDITLLPIGGLARLERMPDDPKQELVVALAGPAVNVALVFILGALFVAAHNTFVASFSILEGPLLPRLIGINIMLALFNLLPAFPMDGGRVLRALLAMRIDYLRATRIAVAVGQGMAFLLGFFGLMSNNPFLVFIALFVWMGAEGEESMARVRTALSGIPVSHAMITDFRIVSPHDSLAIVVDHILAGFQQDFPVEDGGQVVGVLTREGTLKALAAQGAEGRVGDAMERDFVTVGPDELLEHAFSRLQECQCQSVPVVDHGQTVGMLTYENLGEFIAVQSALGRTGR